MTEANSILARKRHLRVVYFFSYVLLGLFIVGWSLLEQGILTYTDNQCELISAQGSESFLMRPLYTALLERRAPALSDKVVVIDIDSSLGIIQQNICTGRAFMSDLLLTVARGQPAAIAVDKFYGKTSCPAGDPSTATLQNTAGGLSVPFIVGESTTAAETQIANACLVETPQLPLGPNTQYGLTRLNQDVLELPLQWSVLPAGADHLIKPAAAPTNSFAVTAAQAVLMPSLQDEHKQNIVNTAQQPYANVTGILTTYRATDILCSDAAPTTAAQWGQCQRTHPLPDLHGKLVVIGSENDTDRPVVLGHGMYGFELQAHYIAALLSGSYVRSLSVWTQLVLLFIYYVISELLLPSMHIHEHLPKPLFHIHHLLLWSAGVLVTALVGIFFGTFFSNRLPPLGLLFGMVAIFIPHLLIESWALLNEQSQGPGKDDLA